MTGLKKPALDPMTIAPRQGTSYPKPFDRGFERRVKRALTEALALSQFGVNLVVLKPGGMSAQRHWHETEDEFIYVITGEATLVTDEGAQLLGPGMCAGFAAGEQNGHHLVNRANKDVHYLEIGTRAVEDNCAYPDIDLKAVKRDGRFRFFTRNGGAL